LVSLPLSFYFRPFPLSFFFSPDHIALHTHDQSIFPIVSSPPISVQREITYKKRYFVLNSTGLFFYSSLPEASPEFFFVIWRSIALHGYFTRLFTSFLPPPFLPILPRNFSSQLHSLEWPYPKFILTHHFNQQTYDLFRKALTLLSFLSNF